ncbi:MAG: hypothetical protein ABH835_00870 [Patescibacteria group bacterium]
MEIPTTYARTEEKVLEPSVPGMRRIQDMDAMNWTEHNGDALDNLVALTI